MKRRDLLNGLSLATLSITSARAQSMLGVSSAPAPSVPAPAAPLAAAAQTQAPKLDDTVGAGFNRIVIARWGDALLPDAPAFNPNALTADQARSQFPYDAVIAGLIAPPPAQDGIPRLVMVVANPTAPARMVFPGGVDIPDVAGRLQGATILNLQYMSGRWVTVDGGYQSRRISDGTLCEITGPVAAVIGSTVQGLLAPQAGCATPWGNALLAEGNAAPWLKRLAGVGYGYDDPAQAPRFGWVAELNALDPGAFPIKRTALGRFARAGIAATATQDGRAVIFMSQDAPGGYLFRFIAATAATDGTALDSGTLAVAQITGDGIGWIDLPNTVPALVGAVDAAANAGGSPFDAPGGIAIATDNSAIYLACGGNAARTVPDALNPRTGDDNGHIVALTPPGGDVTAKSFAGKVVLSAGNPATTPGTDYAAGSNGWLRKPRTLNLAPSGALWIGTDQKGDTSLGADGLFIMQTGGPSPYLLSTAYLAPIGAAMGGVGFGGKTVFAAVRHPGATPGASFNAPATRWPTLRPDMPPQTTIIGLVRV
ncbi:dTDP-glucose 4,6-dehydratase [Acidocella aquatica]|uniref:dTDP-glucose 4,6-dehydratase n=1 Tax=Acidocella aquatica TaxID=1922313 RepID=A0ABQ6A031_9PROT|nr:alkaline phosphatase PhoX [Acidocella aquatica]GLR65814.1 dTDP-glucose 4,6-dehydratase [Acidocella aquatica]